MANGPETFAGRKFGVLVTDGTDAVLLEALRKAADAEGALVELIAPWIGGVSTSDGTLVPAHQHVAGGPSVLYDAVVILASAEGAAAAAHRIQPPKTSSPTPTPTASSSPTTRPLCLCWRLPVSAIPRRWLRGPRAPRCDLGLHPAMPVSAALAAEHAHRQRAESRCGRVLSLCGTSAVHGPHGTVDVDVVDDVEDAMVVVVVVVEPIVVDVVDVV